MFQYFQRYGQREVRVDCALEVEAVVDKFSGMAASSRASLPVFQSKRMHTGVAIFGCSLAG